MTSVVQENLDEYNVVCRSCGLIFTPTVQSALWWKAKNRANKGFIDAHQCTGEECGCVQKLDHPDTPFRVFGYSSLMRDYFDIPCDTFVQAVTEYRRRSREFVFIIGVSVDVQRKLANRPL